MKREGVWRAAAMLACAAPLLLVFDFIARFGANLPFYDEWTVLQLIADRMSGHLTWAQLIAVHNEHRLLFPRLVILGLADLTHYNTVAEMFFTWAELALCVGLLFRAHVARFGLGTRAWLSFIPVPWILCTLRQYETFLWSWAGLQIYMCVAAVLAGAWAVTRAGARPRLLIVAVVAGAVACYSFAAGLVFWPAAAAGVLIGRTLAPPSRFPPWKVAAVMGAAGVGVAALYFFHFQRPPTQPSVAQPLHHPLDALKFLCALLGNVMGGGVTSVPAAGAVVLVLVVVGLVLAARGGFTWEGGVFGGIIVLFSLGGIAFILAGRLGFGQVHATVSRYSTFSALLLVGLYWWMLSLPQKPWQWVSGGVLGACTLMVVFASFDGSYKLGHDQQVAREHETEIVLDYRNRPDDELLKILPTPSYVRQACAFMEAHDLGPFRDHPATP